MAEPWIRVHADLGAKPITHRAAEALSVDAATAAGHLVFFWGNVSRHAQNGAIAHYPDSLLERWAGWDGGSGVFANFIRDNHIDADGRVKEWDEYAGALEVRKQRNREHQAAWRARQKETGEADVSLTSGPRKRVTIRNETKRNEQQEQGGRVRAPDPDWVGLARAQWEAKLGPLKPSRIKSALAPLVTSHGWEATAKGMADYLVATPGSKARIEWFAERGTYWVNLAAMPLMDQTTLQPTERYRVTVEGKAA